MSFMSNEHHLIIKVNEDFTDYYEMMDRKYIRGFAQRPKSLCWDDPTLNALDFQILEEQPCNLPSTIVCSHGSHILH